MRKIPYKLIAEIVKVVQRELELPDNVIITSMDISLRKDSPVKVDLSVDIYEPDVEVEE